MNLGNLVIIVEFANYVPSKGPSNIDTPPISQVRFPLNSKFTYSHFIMTDYGGITLNAKGEITLNFWHLKNFIELN